MAKQNLPNEQTIAKQSCVTSELTDFAKAGVQLTKEIQREPCGTFAEDKAREVTHFWDAKITAEHM